MHRFLFRIALLATFALSCVVGRADLGDWCLCAHCGCSERCCKVCRLVCEEKKVETTCWGCECEDFCVPCHSQPGCEHCECVCGPYDSDGKPDEVCSQSKNFVWKEWSPRGAKIYTKKKLMKKVVTRTIPSYKWVVEDLCPQCQAQLHGDGKPMEAGELPPSPAPPASGLSH